MTLGGLLKHLALVEDDMFSVKLHGRRSRIRRGTPSTGTRTRTGSGAPAAEDSPEQLMTLWQEPVDRSRALVAEALADGGLGRLGRASAWPDGRTPSLRRLLMDMIEEYAGTSATPT